MRVIGFCECRTAGHGHDTWRWLRRRPRACGDPVGFRTIIRCPDGQPDREVLRLYCMRCGDLLEVAP